MRVTRVLDMAIFLLVAVAVLLPRPDVKVKPALAFDQTGRDRVAALQAQLLGHPDDVEAARELGDLFMDGRRPDWTLAVLAPALAGHPLDHRLHALRALALADHFEGAASFRAAERALALCEAGSSAPCGEAEHTRLRLLRSTLERIRDVDMREDPNRAKENLLKGFRPTFLPKARTQAAAAIPTKNP